MPKKVCDKSMSFQDCELSILRMQVDLAQEKIAKRVVGSDDIKRIIQIVEDFIRRKNLICYGGTAINNILPKEDQFYDKDTEIADYDFFTPNGLEDAKELSDIYFKQGFTEVEAKSGQHHGTYKVFVNYIPVADITLVPKEIYMSLKKDAIRVSGILYAPPNFLRMAMYLELSRPAGDTGRWEKVLKRLTLLNKHYPLTSVQCDNVDFQRDMSDKTHEDEIYENIRNTLVNQGVVFFGGYAISLYSQYMPKQQQIKLEKIADFDVLSHDPETTAEIVKERLKDINVKNVKIIRHEPVGDVVPLHFEIKVGKDTIAFIYKPIACHSYNVLMIGGQKVKVATIDTMLNFYLAFLYTDRAYYNQFLERILCMARFLFEVQQKNRLEQKGLLKRFSILCYGHQDSVEEMRAEKAEKFKELKDKRGTREYEEYFLNYRPDMPSNPNPKSNIVKPNSKSDKPQYNQNQYNQKQYKSRKNKSRKFSRNPYNKTRRNKNKKFRFF